MNLLLDTHIFLWSLLEPEKLSPKVTDALVNTKNQIWLSPITTWECLVLARKGRISIRPTPKKWIREQLKILPHKQAPLNHEVAIKSEAVKLSHRDPADRFLAATAIVFCLTLVTADERLLVSSEFTTLANY